MIRLTEYHIKFDVRLRGWIAFKVTKTGVHRVETTDREPVTSAKNRPHLAAQALTRVLFKEDKNAAKN